jgi:very-short-patch-repair endonuclease
MPVTLTCEVCGKQYGVKPASAETSRYCSRRCKGIGSRTPPKTCPVCGKKFYRGCSTNRQTYCSRECFCRARETSREVECAWCGQRMSKPPHQIERASRNFCSRECQNAYQSRNKIDLVCEWCGAAFRVSPSRIDRAEENGWQKRFCCNECRLAARKRMGWPQLLANNKSLQEGRPTSLELAGYAILDALGVQYEKQVEIGGKFIVDARMPDSAIIIQWDGDYWHGNPDFYDELDERQEKRRRLDHSQDAYLHACGYRVLRFWEHEVHDTPEEVRARIAHAAASVSEQSTDTSTQVPDKPVELPAPKKKSKQEKHGQQCLELAVGD